MAAAGCHWSSNGPALSCCCLAAAGCRAFTEFGIPSSFSLGGNCSIPSDVAGQAPLLHDPCPSPLSAAYSLLDTPQLMLCSLHSAALFFCRKVFSIVFSQPALTLLLPLQHHSSLNSIPQRPSLRQHHLLSSHTPPPPYQTPKKKACSFPLSSLLFPQLFCCLLLPKPRFAMSGFTPPS